MDQATYDVIVVGIGGMGSATAWQLARRGVRVLGLEQFDAAHDKGASHGDTRLIRKAYFEHPDYVPLLNRAYDLWDDLEAESGRRLFHRTGLILAGNPGTSQVVAGVKKAAREHNLAIETWSAAQAREMYPQFNFDNDWEVLFEEDAGFLRVEECVKAHSDMAEKHGARILYNTKVTSWESTGHGPVRVMTSAGTFQAERLVITSGPWATALLRPLGLNLHLRRMVQHWFEAPPAFDERHGMPCFGLDTDKGFFYGMPAREDVGLKAASHSHGTRFEDPDFMDRSDKDPDLGVLTEFLSTRLKGMPLPRSIKAKPCIYTMSADEHFIIDAWPLPGGARSQSVFFAAGFSGHGFKFATVIGELLADLALTGDARVPFDFLRLRPTVRKQEID
ncbi:N-methyl-L-tryptophan oxidase [bacterium]|nr:N-methyl-L-tryptophan oxidase [bacterium]